MYFPLLFSALIIVEERTQYDSTVRTFSPFFAEALPAIPNFILVLLLAVYFSNWFTY